MLLQKEKQSIEEIGKKDKKIYERRKVSLSNIYDLLFPQKSRKYFRTNAKEHIGEISSVKVSFCTSFQQFIHNNTDVSPEIPFSCLLLPPQMPPELQHRNPYKNLPCLSFLSHLRSYP